MIEVDEYEQEDEYLEEEEFEISYGGNPEDDIFDSIVGRIQDLVMSDEFISLQTQFFQNYCQVFTNDEENRLEYMPIF